MKKIIKLTTTVICSMLMCKGFSTKFPPECSRHEFSVYAGGGLSSLNYDVTFGEQRQNLGGHFGLGYHFFLSSNWAIGTGLEFGLYRANFEMNNLNFSFLTTDFEGVEFEFRSIINNFEERQRALLLQIPLMLHFQTGNFYARQRFFMSAGGKIGIPIRGRYSNTLPFNNVGYFPFENALYDTQTFMGFGHFPNRNHEQNLNLRTTFSLSAEAGMKWRLNDRNSLYIGLYVDYGLTNILRNQSQNPELLEFNTSEKMALAVNSIVHSQFTEIGSNTTQNFTDNVNPIAFGIRVRMGINRPCNRPVAEPVEAPGLWRGAEAQNCDEIQRALDEARQALAESETARDLARQALEDSETARELTEQELADAKENLRQAEEKTRSAVIRFLEMPIEHYALNQTEPGDYQRQRLDEKIALLKQYPDLKFYIHGHTCDRGISSANERVGFGRDAGVRAYLIANGIDESRILDNICKRDTQPVVSNTTEENRRKNRRVELVIQ